MTHLRSAASDPARAASARLQHPRLGSTVRSFDTVSSTNDLALEWASDGAPHGALVFAEYQERGRGRLGRTWSAAAGVNLTFSLILRPSLPPDRWGLITLASCVAAAGAIESACQPVSAQIKWPNDVLIEGRKCCGMLLESKGSSVRSSGAVVLGIGINVNQASFPSDLEDRATSLLLATGRPVDRTELLVSVLTNLDRELDLLPEGAPDVRRRYMLRMRDLNERIELRYTEQKGAACGIATGLSDDGGLLLATDDGMRVFHAGEVTRSA